MNKMFSRSVAVVPQPAPQSKPVKVLEISSIIGDGMQFQGDVELSTGLRIDGGLAGNIRKKGAEAGEVAVHVASTGKVHGNIVADIVIIDGEVIGNVWAMKNLIVRGLIRGRASYGEAVELSGTIEAEISRMGHMEFKDIDAMQEQMSAQAHSETSDTVRSSKSAEPLSLKPPRAPRKQTRTTKAAAAEAAA